MRSLLTGAGSVQQLDLFQILLRLFPKKKARCHEMRQWAYYCIYCVFQLRL
jgi:hypothetical protein